MDKGALELFRAATTKPRQIERSGIFLLDHNGQTRVYRLVLGPTDVPLRRKHDSQMEEDDCDPPMLIRVNYKFVSNGSKKKSAVFAQLLPNQNWFELYVKE